MASLNRKTKVIYAIFSYSFNNNNDMCFLYFLCSLIVAGYCDSVSYRLCFVIVQQHIEMNRYNKTRKSASSTAVADSSEQKETARKTYLFMAWRILFTLAYYDESGYISDGMDFFASANGKKSRSLSLSLFARGVIPLLFIIDSSRWAKFATTK